MESLISAGFLLIRPSPRPNWPGECLENFLPEQVLSASECLCPRFPGTYVIHWSSDSEDERKHQFEKIGLTAERQKEATDWATERFDQAFGWPNVFYRLEDAVAARTCFFPFADLRIIGLGLSLEYVESFVDYATPPPQQPGYAPIGSCGYYETAQRHAPLPEGGNLLGYELVNVDVGLLTCSWLCLLLEKHCALKLGVFPATNGLLRDLDSTKQCLEEITNGKMGMERGLWFPWALVEYG
jgi:hypothetical protein